MVILQENSGTCKVHERIRIQKEREFRDQYNISRLENAAKEPQRDGRAAGAVQTPSPSPRAAAGRQAQSSPRGRAPVRRQGGRRNPYDRDSSRSHTAPFPAYIPSCPLQALPWLHIR